MIGDQRGGCGRRFAFLAALGLLGGRAAAVDLVSCAQLIPVGETAVLVADLSCPPPSPGVVLGRGSTLQLNGHRLAGGGSAVYCVAQCTVEGPGEVTGSAGDGIHVESSPRLLRLTVAHVDIHDNAGFGVRLIQRGTVRLEGCQITGNLGGIDAAAGTVIGEDITIRDNAGSGIADCRNFRFTRLVLQNNGIDTTAIGLIAYRGGLLVDSVVSSNGGVDVATRRRPRLRDSSCGRSGVIPESLVLPGPTDPSWDVCTGD